MYHCVTVESLKLNSLSLPSSMEIRSNLCLKQNMVLSGSEEPNIGVSTVSEDLGGPAEIVPLPARSRNSVHSSVPPPPLLLPPLHLSSF